MKKNGFTLVEVIVAAGIFAIVSVVIAQLFVTANRAQQRGGISQKVQSDARIMMAQLADRIRSSQIDYAQYTLPISSPIEQLHLLDEFGRPVAIRKGNTVCPANSSPCLEISEAGGPFFPMSSQDFTVDVVRFYIDPADDPAVPGGPDIQPRVTFVLGIQSTERASETGTIYIQSTASSRVYFR